MSANRMIVFRALQRYMDRHHRCPTSAEVVSMTGLGETTCWTHMKALDGAAGLRFSTNRTKSSDRSSGWVVRKFRQLDPYTSPIDRLMA